MKIDEQTTINKIETKELSTVDMSKTEGKLFFYRNVTKYLRI